MSTVTLSVQAPATASQARAAMPIICHGMTIAHGNLLRMLIEATDKNEYAKVEQLQKDISALMGSMVELTAVELYLINRERDEQGKKSAS